MIDPSKIKSLQIRRKKSIGRGIGIGAATGALLGVVIGYAVYTPADCGHQSGPYGSFDIGCNDVGPEGYAAGGAAIGAVLGIGVGALIGSAVREIKIDGQKTSFDFFASEFR